jgi:serine/threonine protein kinase
LPHSFRARINASGVTVAMKKLTGKSEVHGADPSALREIRALKEISHANVIGLVDAFIYKTWAARCIPSTPCARVATE